MSGVRRFHRALDEGRVTDLQLFLLVFLIVFPVFVATANTRPPYNMDTLTNVLSAETIGRTGSPVMHDRSALADAEVSGVLTWVVESPRGPVSKYPPGTALLAAVPYAFTGAGELVELSLTNVADDPPVPVRIPSLWPGALVASLASAIAAAFTALTVRQLTSARWAVATALVLAFGTGLWLNGAFRLWQHGVAGMWIAMGVWAATGSRWLPSGLSLGIGILTRPTVALISLGLGGFAGWRAGQWRPTLLHGCGAAVGVAALLAYNYWLWDAITVAGGYGDAYDGALTDQDVLWFLRNVAGGLLSLDRGLFVWSPVVLVAGVGLPRMWKELPGWALGAFIGGLLMLLLQWRLNRYSGGTGFLSYRYPVESMVAAAPALAMAAYRIWQGGGRLRLVLPVCAATSVALHVMGAAIQMQN